MLHKSLKNKIGLDSLKDKIEAKTEEEVKVEEVKIKDIEKTKPVRSARSKESKEK